LVLVEGGLVGECLVVGLLQLGVELGAGQTHLLVLSLKNLKFIKQLKDNTIVIS
jgi:hypothetical protein